MKRKRRNGKNASTNTGRKPPCLAKSDDSGVFVDYNGDLKTNDLEMENVRETNQSGCKTEVNNFQVSIPIALAGIRSEFFQNKVCNQYESVGTTLECSGTINLPSKECDKGPYFDNDNCLDYEYESADEEPEDYQDSLNSLPYSPLPSEHGALAKDSSKQSEVQEETENNILNGLLPSEYCVGDSAVSSIQEKNMDTYFSNKLSDTRKNAEHENINLSAECAEEDSEQEDNAVIVSDEDFQSCQDEENVFMNADIKFNGINITISRPVINYTESPNSNSSDNSVIKVTNNNLCSAGLKPVEISNKSRPRSNISVKSKELENAHNKTWLGLVPFDSDLVKINSEDDIFMYSLRMQRNYRHWIESGSTRSITSSISSDLLSLSRTTPRVTHDYAGLNSSTPVDTFGCCSPNLYYSTSVPQTLDVSTVSIEADIPCTGSLSEKHGNFDNAVGTSSSSESPILKRTHSSGTLGSPESRFKHPVKRPPTRPKKSSADVSPVVEDDLISISTRLDDDDRSEASQDDTNLPADDKNEFVNQWLENTNEILESLCGWHFTSRCEDDKCTRSHFIDGVANKIKNLSPQKLTEIYKMAQQKKFWYIHLFDVFIDCFSALPSALARGILINVINDVFAVFDGTFIDKTSYISKIVKALERTGLSFKEAVDDIILRYGHSHISTICDILLFIISTEPKLNDHWSLVRKITFGRKEKLDPVVVINMCNAAFDYYPPDKKLCTNICTDILDKNLLDPEKIPANLLAGVVKLHRKIIKSPKQNEKNHNVLHAIFPHQNSDHSALLNFEDVDYFQAASDSFSQTSEFNKSLALMLGAEYRTSPQIDNPFPLIYGINQIARPSRNNHTYLFEKPRKTGLGRSIDTRTTCSSMNTNENNSRPPEMNDAVAVEEISLQDFSGLHDNGTSTYCPESLHTNTIFKVPKYYPPKCQPKLQNSSHTHSKQSEPSISKSVYNNEVLHRINKSWNPPRPTTPANVVAHPSRLPSINSRYKCNISLHNLYPEVQDSATEISTGDLHQLKNVLTNMDGSGFLEILRNYQDSFTIESFILNTFTLIKSSTVVRDVLKNFISLLDAIGIVEPDHMSRPHIKMVVEVLAMNLIFFLESKGEWQCCMTILSRVRDWHSLVTSKIFYCISHLMSHMHRYFYIVKVLCRAGSFYWANEILQLNVLNLLETPSKWPYQSVSHDLQARSAALKLFFEDGFCVDVVAINDLLRHITVVIGGNIEGFDVWQIMDDKLTALLDSGEEYRNTLELLFRDVGKYYGYYINNHVLQGYFMYMRNKVSETEAFKLFKLCCVKGIYHNYTGKERLVVIRTTMSDFEISCLLECFLENIIGRAVEPHDFWVELRLPESEQPSSPQILRSRLNRSVFEVFASIVNIFKAKYKILVEQSVECRILISRKMQESLFFLHE